MRRGLGLTEIVLAAFVIGVSALPVLELIRSSTSSLEVTEAEVAARSLAADVLEQIAARTVDGSSSLDVVSSKFKGVPRAWDVVLDQNAALREHFPRAELAPILNLVQARVTVDWDEPYGHPALGTGSDLTLYKVTVAWQAPGDLARGEREVTLARLTE